MKRSKIVRPVVDLSRLKIREMAMGWDPLRPMTYSDDGERFETLFVKLHVQDAETREPTLVYTSESISPFVFESTEGLKRLIYYVAQRALLHELDECLYIDGKRYCVDPHQELKGKP